MSTISIRRFSAPILFAVISLSAGVVGGTTTVHGLTSNTYGPPFSILTPSPDALPISTAQDCQGCSDRDLGYHWASIRRLASIADCPIDSWDFRRGCVAYLHDTGGI